MPKPDFDPYVYDLRREDAFDLSSGDYVGDDLTDQDLNDLWAHFSGDPDLVHPDSVMVGWWEDKPHQIVRRLLCRLTRAEALLDTLTPDEVQRAWSLL